MGANNSSSSESESDEQVTLPSQPNTEILMEIDHTREIDISKTEKTGKRKSHNTVKAQLGTETAEKPDPKHEEESDISSPPKRLRIEDEPPEQKGEPPTDLNATLKDPVAVLPAPAAPLRLALRMLRKSKQIETNSPIPIYRLTVRKTCQYGKSNIAKCEVGIRTPASPEKVLMLVGATGSGKTTLINGLANYVMGVEWDDPFRFKLVTEEGGKSQAHSQTTWITAYKLHKFPGSPLPYTLTIIDTPGFGDTRGLVRDQEIAAQIKELFSLKGDCGVDQIHAIGFVAQAPLARLTPPQKYIFDSILAIFGKDIGDNIFMMVTFADGQRPPLLDAVKEANIPFCKSFKFNNSTWFAENSSVGESFDKLFWNMGTTSCCEFFKELEKVESKSLQLTREVLKERGQLETFIQGLQPKIRSGLSKIDQLQQEEDILAKHEAQIRENQNFKYQVTETKQRKVDLVGEYVTNCLTCNYTCHYPCTVAADVEKFRCSAMKRQTEASSREEACCIVCPGQCSWQKHVNNSYRFELYQESVTKTSDDLKQRYDQAITGKSKVESMISNIQNEIKQLNDTVFDMIGEVQQSLQRLEEIALKPNPLSEVEYIDLLIESEKQEAQPGWKQRVQYYEKVREQAHLLSKVKDEKGNDHHVLAKARTWVPSPGGH